MSFREFLSALEKSGHLVRVTEELSTIHEIPAAIRFLSRKGKAAFFENVKGYQVPVAGNILGQRSFLKVAMGLEGEEEVTEEFIRRTAKPVPPVVVETGPVKECAEEKVDITDTIPVLTHHEKDIAPYFTSAIIIAKDPETGIRGMGVHRLQVRSKNQVGIFLGSPPLSEFFKKAEAIKKDLEVAICVGIDPLTWLAAVAWAPYGVDKFDLAGALVGRPVELVRCNRVNLEVPEETEFLLEGRVLAGVRETDGPFGESNGVYCAYQNPVIQVDLISHRRDPVYHALMPFTSEDAVLLSVSWEAQNLKQLKEAFPPVLKMHLDELDWTRAIIQIRKTSDAEPEKIINHALNNFFFLKSIVIVDDDIDVYDPWDVCFALATRYQPDQDTFIVSGVPGSPLDPSTTFTGEAWISSKIGFDATITAGKKEVFEKIKLSSSAVSRIEKLFR